ncbi:MAG: chromate transporter [Prevotella sp.]|nr:chromate transporter [Candidatus Equicola stercoris]
MFRVFATFFKIGLFTIGGGYAMIPMIEREVVHRYHWLEKRDFLDLIALAQSCPGVFAINISIFIGYKLKKTSCALIAALGAALPSFIIILLIAMFFQHFEDNRVVAAIFKGLRPAVVALVALPVFTLAKTADISWKNIWVPVLVAVLITYFSVSSVLIVIVAGICGVMYGKYIIRKS